MLAPVFTALHEATWAGVPGFEFVWDEDDEESGRCSLVFAPPP